MDKQTTPEDRIRALSAAATPAPWQIGPGKHRVSNGTEIVCGAWHEYGCGPESDAALIAASRNTIDLLCDVVAKARTEAASHRSLDSGWCPMCGQWSPCPLVAALAALDAAEAER